MIQSGELTSQKSSEGSTVDSRPMLLNAKAVAATLGVLLWFFRRDIPAGYDVTLLKAPGSAIVDSATSFGMIRSGKIDVAILGAMEVNPAGDIANWMVPGAMVKGMGGAMDLVASAKNIIVAMQHTDRAGNSKLLAQCSLPITGLKCVKKVVTDLGFFEITAEGFLLKEYAPGVSIEEIKAKTAGRLIIADDVKEIAL